MLEKRTVGTLLFSSFFLFLLFLGSCLLFPFYWLSLFLFFYTCVLSYSIFCFKSSVSVPLFYIFCFPLSFSSISFFFLLLAFPPFLSFHPIFTCFNLRCDFLWFSFLFPFLLSIFFSCSFSTFVPHKAWLYSWVISFLLWSLGSFSSIPRVSSFKILSSLYPSLVRLFLSPFIISYSFSSIQCVPLHKVFRCTGTWCRKYSLK